MEAIDGDQGLVLSGESLARHLGLSRTAVWKQIQALKHMGLPIESSRRQGYRLGAPFDNSLVALEGRAGVIPHYYVSTPSTQTLGKAGAASGLPEGHLWIAETQSRGRGRLERLWESSYGGLWFSLLLRPRMPSARIAPLTLVAGLALRQAVQDVCHVKAKLKWPNDLLVYRHENWKKCGGILTEMSGQIEKAEWVVIGVGLNVNNALSRELSGRAISLFEATETAWPRGQIVDAFLNRFWDAYRCCSRVGFKPFQKEYWENYFAPGEMTHLKTATGEITGKMRGVDAHGAILIESRRKIRAFSEGEIVL
jgi:BirA family biotin operon repressor/biotin-[acetyl-CoA-carboxylase] ligase